MTGNVARPRIRHNDYSPLVPPELGHWTPTLPVSVVIPAHSGQHRLDLTLAALSSQSYPDSLLDVIVVDDASDPPLRLPEIRPGNTRLIRSAPDGWGPAHALNTGVAVAEGAVIQRLDSDMIIHREHLEALLRWHHLTDYVVTIGAKQFIEEPDVSPAEVRDAVAADRLETLLDLSRAVPSSTERTIVRLDGLRRSRNPYHVCTGPTLSLPRTLFQDVGGLNGAVQRGEDTEFAYRLAQAGAVFVPDMEARAEHLGLPSQRRNRATSVRAVEPFLANLVPLRRDLRKDRGRIWRVPYVEVVMEVAGVAERVVRQAVSAALTGTVHDVRVTLVAPWSAVAPGRMPEHGGWALELRLLLESLSDDPRVALVETLVPNAAPVPFRLRCTADTPLAPTTLDRMTRAMIDGQLGMLLVNFSDGRHAVLERTEAVNRARLLMERGETIAAVVHETHGVRQSPSSSFWPAPEAEAEESALPLEPGTPQRRPIRERLNPFLRQEPDF
ncbi:glycosyltransferase [Acrocarpospora sp. B8E8]|uniref:glycosyltransferase n=1 Tax=Acrocarpospora sp. B8E8 TaxID=3153572 RepID=UPI00325CEECC